MFFPYFVVARCSGNIIRIIQRSSPPSDSDTVMNVHASTMSLHRYQSLFDAGHDLISLKSVLQ
ncbi:hypothetical protein [Aquipseudomonas guryensis]|jgi:hypothetical protein|uniref:Uncharacterized protein n=1 Tax=Aquipseudomonas guryensis TaxID=2759165 RepID=A0A7W4H4H2_9GAMM|nr:hypothetical protein [Pseudomonas guryensis]MBB1520539.1 hypothetical protein [Pseudomonas guryensis]